MSTVIISAEKQTSGLFLCSSDVFLNYVLAKLKPLHQLKNSKREEGKNESR